MDILINKCLTCPFEIMGNSVHLATTKENKTSICCRAPKSSCIPFDVFSRVPLLSRRIHNCAITSFLLSVPPVKLFLILSVMPVPWSPVRCQQVPVLSGCLHILSFKWNTTCFSPVTTMSFLHSPPPKPYCVIFILTSFYFLGFLQWLNAATPRSFCTITQRNLYKSVYPRSSAIL